MSYQVFARKYRPQTFDDVIGQEHITRTLKNAIAQNRLAHAYLFVGPRGIGKTSTARILAKALCCVKAPTVEPCGVCDSCREIAAGISLDVLEIDGASNNGVEQVRELRENVRYAPTRGKYKIYIIDEVHMLTSAAFNALLKTLEEPPEHVKFIFATTEPQKVLATILSRCQRFDLRRIPGLLIAAHLQKIAGLENIELAPDAADAIARGADGGLRDAESMLDQLVAFCGGAIALEDVLGIFGFTAPETVARLADAVLTGATAEALALLDAQGESGKDLLRLMGELIGHLRNLLVFQVNPAGVEAEAGDGMQAVFERQAAFIPTDRLLELIDAFAAAEGRMKWAPNKKLHFEIALIKAVQTLGQSTLTEVIDALAALRAGGAAPSSAEPRPSAAPPPPAAPARLDWSSVKKAVAKPAAPRPAPPGAAAIPEAEPDHGSGLQGPVSPKTALIPEAEPDHGSGLKAAVLPEPPPLAPAPEPVPEPLAKEPAPPPAPEPAVDGPRVWRDLIAEIKSQRPLITAWVQSGRLLGADHGIFRVGFATGQKMVAESLGKANNRKFLETLLARLARRPITLKFELTDDLPPEMPPEPAASPSSRRNDPAASKAAVDDPVESFKNDPKIQEALQLFEGEIRSVQPGDGAAA